MKAYSNDINDDLLVKYLVGEASELESAKVEAWIAAGEDNRKYYNQYKTVWEQSRKLVAEDAVSEDLAWERFKQFRKEKQSDPAPVIQMKFPFGRALRIAAIFILIAAGALWYLMNRNEMTGSGKQVSLRSLNGVLSDTLPDGSLITLNKQSTLSYQDKFSGKNRAVVLEGEAFFTVAPNKNKPFIIHIQDVDIQVLGTSFNVKNSGGRTEVIVETGSVEVSKKGYMLKLNPGEMAVVYNNQPRPVMEKSTDELYNYYRTKEFVCNATPLWKLVDVLNEAYGAHIVIAGDRLKDLPLTTTFHDEPLEDILKVIRETFNIRTEEKGGQIILK